MGDGKDCCRLTGLDTYGKAVGLIEGVTTCNGEFDCILSLFDLFVFKITQMMIQIVTTSIITTIASSMNGETLAMI